MSRRRLIGLAALIASSMLAASHAQAFDDAKYPNLKGQWDRIGGARFDTTHPFGNGAPLTPEYQAIHDANLADQAEGGHGTDPTISCLAPGMPRVMNLYEPMEIVVTPETTYIMIEHIHDNRRIYTDGRDWPEEIEPSFGGYSIGKWVDRAGRGRFDLLEVETRGLKGPHSYDASGIPFHSDNQAIIKERIYLDEADQNRLHDDITVMDHALTRPWTVSKSYHRDPNPRPFWRERVCAEGNEHVVVGKDDYMVSADGYLMPVRKNQPPPDLRYFKAAK